MTPLERAGKRWREARCAPLGREHIQAVAKTLHEAERTERAAMRMCKGEAQAVHLAAAQRHADTRRALLLVLDLLDAIGGAS